MQRESSNAVPPACTADERQQRVCLRFALPESFVKPTSAFSPVWKTSTKGLWLKYWKARSIGSEVANGRDAKLADSILVG
jgi:hypothetical protein